MYTCQKCSYSTDRKLNYERHCVSDRHIINHQEPINQAVAEELMMLKITEMKLKEEIREKQMERKQEIKQKEQELKQKLKNDMKAMSKEDPNKGLSRNMIAKSICLMSFMENVINRQTIEDYHNIFNGVTDFDALFFKHVEAEYETNKSIVFDKKRNLIYYKNEVDVWRVDRNDKTNDVLKRFSKLIPMYHSYLKELAKENDYPVKDFILSESVHANLHIRLLETITHDVVMPTPEMF